MEETPTWRPVGEAALVGFTQLALVGVYAPSLPVLLAAGVFVPYGFAVRWADPLQLPRSDALLVLGWIGFLTLPIVAMAGGGTWALMVLLSTLAVGLSRIQFLPTPPDPESFGVEAHVRRVRRGEVVRPKQGNAEGVPRGPDTLADLYGGGFKMTEAPPDPYERSRVLHVDPEEP